MLRIRICIEQNHTWRDTKGFFEPTELSDNVSHAQPLDFPAQHVFNLLKGGLVNQLRQLRQGQRCQKLDTRVVLLDVAAQNRSHS